MKKLTVLMVAGALLAGLSLPCLAADVPVPANATVRLVVPYSPGGGYDTYARLMAPYLEKTIKKMGGKGIKVIVTNVTGGGGSIGTTQVYTAKPDGKTVLFLDPETSLWQQMLMDAKFDITKFEALAQMSIDAMGLIVSTKSGIDSWEAFKARSQKEPILIGTSGNGNYDHLYPVMFQLAMAEQGVKLDFSYLHNKGVGPMMASMRRGEAEAAIEVVTSFYGFIKEGNAKFLFTLTDQRHSMIPDTPTFAEVVGADQAAKLGDLIASANFHRVFVLAPKADKALVDFYANAFAEAMKDPELHKKAETAKRPITYAPAAEVGQVIKQMYALAAEYKDQVQKAIGK